MPLPRAGEGLQPSEATRLQDHAAALTRQGRWGKAVEPLGQLHAAFPESHVHMERLAVAYRKLSRFADEAAMWEKFLERAPLPYEACPQIGHAYRDAKMMDRMFIALERCRTLDPRSPDAVFHLAHAHERHGSSDTANRLYAEGVGRFPENTDLSLGLARVMRFQGRGREAGEIAQKVLQGSPDNVDALLVAGLCLRSEGDLKGAKGLLERGARLSPAYTDFFVALADIAEQQADAAAVVANCRRVLALDPGNRAAAGKLEAYSN